jgi:hypothetical protein
LEAYRLFPLSLVRFVNSAFGVWPLWRYSLVERGHFSICSTRIGFWLSTKVALAVSLGIVALAALVLSPSSNSVLQFLAILVGIWLYLFTLNYALLWFRNRRFLRALVASCASS